jgi:hypothetical protein
VTLRSPPAHSRSCTPSIAPRHCPTNNLLGAFPLLNKTETAVSTNHFLGVFGLTDHLEAPVQRLGAEPANAPGQRLQMDLNAAAIARQSAALGLLAGMCIDRPSTSPHRSPPGCFRDERSPLTTALTDKLLSAFPLPNKTETTASLDRFLGAFGLTNNPEKRVQGLGAEPANDSRQRLPESLHPTQAVLVNPLHANC